MSSKKKHRKKHFNPKTAISEPRRAQFAQPASEAVVTPKPVISLDEQPQLRLIRHDIRRVAVLAGGFVLLQVILWYLFNNTGLGSAAYRLIQP